MPHVDALSRNPCEASNSDDIIERSIGVFLITNTEDEITMYQFTDSKLRRKSDILQKPASARTKHALSEIKDYELLNGILYKRVNGKLLYVIPSALRKSLVIRFHDLQSHTGLDRTISKIKQFYYFLYMTRCVRQHIHGCIQCLFTKTKTGPQAGQLYPVPPAHRPFSLIYIDHVGPFVTTPSKNRYILVIADTLTKFVILNAVRDTKTKNLIKILENVILDFGAPDRIISDPVINQITSKISGPSCCYKHLSV